MVLDAQPLEDEADYGRLIELGGAGDFSEEKLPPPLQRLLGLRTLSTFFCIVWMGKKGGRWKTDQEGGKRKASGVDRPFRFL